MRAICMSGLMSGDWKRSYVSPDCGGGAKAPPQPTGRLRSPRQSSTLLLVPGGRWLTVISILSSSARA